MSFKDILDRISDGFIVLDKNRNYVYLNKIAEEIAGKKQEELLGKSIGEEFDIPGEGTFYDAFHKAMDKQEPVFTESYYRQLNKWFEINFYPSEEDLTIHFRDITGRKKAEEKIKKHSERTEMIAGAVHDSLWEWNIETGEMWSNEGHQQLFGRGNVSQPALDEWIQRIHPDDREKTMKPLEDALANKISSWESEFRFLKDGDEYITFLSRCFTVRNKEGKVVRIAGTNIDITERKKSEEKVRKYNERFEMIARVLHDAIWEWNLETGELWANEVHQQLFGLTQADPVPTVDQWFGQIHPEDRERVKKKHREALASDIDYWEIEYRFLKSTGEYVMISDRSYVLRNSNGKAIWLTGTMNDITKKKKAEEELKASEETRRLIMESSLDAIVCINTEGLITRWTRQAEKIFGWKEEEVFGKQLAETIIPAQYRDSYRKGLQHYLQTGSGSALNKLMELTAINRKGTEFPVELSIVAIDQGTGKFFCGFIRDITERKKVEQLLLASEKSLREVLSSSAERFYVIDRDCKITLINKVAESKLTEAWGSPVTIGTNILDFIPPEEKEPVRASLKKVFAGEEVEYELYWDKDDPAVWVTVNYRPVYDNNNKVIGAYIATKDITERKKAETEIINARELADRLIESLPGVFYFFDHTGKMLRWNKQAEQVTGYSAEEMAVMNPEQFFTAGTRELIIGKIKEAFENGESHVEADFTTKSGRKIPYYFRSIRMFYDGKPCLVGAGIDLSERKKAEAETLKEKELADKLIDSMPGTFYFIDDTGKFLRWNKQMEKVSGYTAEEIANMRPADFFTGEAKQNIIKKMQEAFDKGEAGAETAFTTKAGQLVPYYLKGIRLMYDGKPSLVGAGIDLTERKQAEAEIIKARELADKLIDSLPGTFYLFDHTGKLLRWNRQLETVTGYTPEEIANMHPAAFFTIESQSRINEKIKEAFEKGQADTEAEIITKAGQVIPYFFKGARIFYDDKPCVVGTGTDITERALAQKKLEDSFLEIRELTEHLQNIREEERAHIAREIHDELGQQLTVLKMDVSWLNKKMQDAGENIRSKLGELASMLDDTVKTVRRISSELRPSLLDDLGLVAAIDWHLREFEKRTGIRTIFREPDTDIIVPDVNITGLFRIFQESLTNVARHANANKVVVSLQQEDGYLVLHIRDNGKGFDQQIASNKRTLGILGMRERTLMMKGSYEISSEPGKGTVVTVSIPATKQGQY